MKAELNIGIIGAGSFAAFATQSFLKIKGIKIIAVSDVNEHVGKQLAKKLSAKFFTAYDDLLVDTDVDLVYIATPPFLQFEISKKSLLAGKHVLCEKPAALRNSEVKELKILAIKLKLLYVVNLMQRYNHLYKVIKIIIDQKLMGNFLHGFFENYASDENLHKEHWFWDETKSGGIFIEHGVHFFDMFSGWLGKGLVIKSLQLQRKYLTTTIYDRVQATVLYDGGTVNFYHGFNQPKILDRQEMRLQFERGDITLYEWIPVKMKLHGLFTNEQLKKITELIGSCSIIKHNRSNQIKEKAIGKFADIIFDEHVTIKCGNRQEKQNRYQQMLMDMLQDQWSWIKNGNHIRIITEDNAIEALSMAEHAKQIAQKF